MRSQPLVCVTDVEASSAWYQRLLGCRGAHGGRRYEQLVKDGGLILQLHSFDVEDHHGPIGNRADRPYGNGVLLWFEVDDFDAAMQRAAEMGVDIVLPRHRNPPDGDGGPNHWECWMRDPDGYTVVIASPYGTADGAWRPGPDLFTQLERTICWSGMGYPRVVLTAGGFYMILGASLVLGRILGQAAMVFERAIGLVREQRLALDL